MALGPETQTAMFLRLQKLTLQLGLRRAADAILPEDGRVVHEREAQLWLQVKVLPAAGSHGGVEHIRYVKGHTQGHVGLDQVKHLWGSKIHHGVYLLDIMGEAVSKKSSVGNARIVLSF